MRKIFVIGLFFWICFFTFFSQTQATYSGNLSGRFLEPVVFSFNSTSQIYGYFTTDHRVVTQSQSLPIGGTLTNGNLVLSQRGGVVIANPQSTNPFYRISVTLSDTGQTAATDLLTLLDALWSYTTPSKGLSAGIDTNNSTSTYWYEHNQFKKVGDLGWDGAPITQAQYDLSRQLLSKFIRRHSGDIKIDLYVTPIGIYPVIDGANFASFPDLYIGSYVMPPTQINYIVLGKWDSGSQSATFKNLEITSLDNQVAQAGDATVDEVNAYYMRQALKDPAFMNTVSGYTGNNGTVDNFKNALWAAALYRGYDYYFKSYNLPKAQSLMDFYLSYLPTYINQQNARYGVESTSSVNFDFINTTHSNPWLAWAMVGYLTSGQKNTLQSLFASVADKIMDFTRPFDANSVLKFPPAIGYLGDTKGEEIAWPLSFLGGYYTAFPQDQPRANRILDYLKFYGFIAMSTSADDAGESMESAYFGSSRGDFLKQKLLQYGTNYSVFSLMSAYSIPNNKIAFTSTDPVLQTFKAKYMHPDGKIDNHAYHPSLNYGVGVVNTSLFVRNGLQKRGMTLDPLGHNLDLAYQGTVLNYADLTTLRLNQYIPKWQYNCVNQVCTPIQPLTTAIEQDNFLLDPTGFIVDYKGMSKPSHLEDWGTSSVYYQIFEHYGDYARAKQVALNTYYRFYSGTGKLFCGYTLINGQYCQADSSGFFNYSFPQSILTMLLSTRSGFNPDETIQPTQCPFSTRSLDYDPGTQTTRDFVTRGPMSYQRDNSPYWKREDLASSSHYRENVYAPCWGKTTGSCQFTTRTVHYDYANNNRLVESITIGPKYYNWSSDTGWWPIQNNDLTSPPRYSENIHAPCYGKSAGTCIFTTRYLYVESGTNKTQESITIGSNIYNWSSDIGWWSMTNHDITGDLSFYGENSNAPCWNKANGSCAFDTRLRYYDKNGILHESLTIGDQYYNYSFNSTGWWPLGDNRNGAASRYNEVDGPCIP